MTQDLSRRIREHRNECLFVQVLFKEEFFSKFEAARRERQIKGWIRKKKLVLISGNLELLKKL